MSGSTDRDRRPAGADSPGEGGGRMFDLSAWGAFEWIMIGTGAAFFLGPPLILGLLVFLFAPGLLGRMSCGGSWSLIPGRGGRRADPAEQRPVDGRSRPA
jgi:hypothetical protein